MKKLSFYKNITVIIPAAGIGRRMKINYPKQYLTIGNNTILEHSISCFLYNKYIKNIIIVLNNNDIYFNKLPLAKNKNITTIKTFGNSRLESVLSGLQLVKKKTSWVLIHDAVRPCLNKDDLERLILALKNNKNGVILATPVNDTMKIGKFNEDKKTVIVNTITRKNLWHALTPQVFPYFLLKKCLILNYNKGINVTDEASALENFGYYPEIVVGCSNNIKVTTYADLEFVKFYFLNKDQKKIL